MKMQHRVPVDKISYNMTGKLDPAYEAEVEKSTQKLEREWQRAQKRLESARKSAENARLRAESAKTAKKEKDRAQKEYKKALALIEERQAELREIELMMTYSPAGSQNRGNKSYRPVPIKGK